MINTALTALSFLFALTAAACLWRAVVIANGLSSDMEKMSRLQRKVTELETDFVDKFDAFASKMNARAAMRAKREKANADEQSEDSNSTQVILPV